MPSLSSSFATGLWTSAAPQESPEPFSPEAVTKARGVDLRLVPVALGCWLMVAAIILTRSFWPLAIGGFITLASSVWWWRARRSYGAPWRRLLARSLATVGAVASAVGLGTWWRIFLIDAQPLLQNLSTQSGSVQQRVTVVGLPKQVAEGTVLVPVDVDSLGEVPLFLRPDLAGAGAGAGGVGVGGAGGGTVGAGDLTALQPGMSFDIAANMRPARGAEMVPVTLSATRAPENISDPEGIWGVTAWLRRDFDALCVDLPWEAGKILPGMVMGDVSMQDSTLRNQFAVTGLSHLSAVSGSNVAVVTGAALVLATACRAGRLSRLLVAAGALVAFVLLVGPEPSVLRAAIMGCVGLVAVASARWTDIIASLSAAIIVLMVLSPSMAISYAFVLSVVATAGIVVVLPWWSKAVLARMPLFPWLPAHERPTQLQAMVVRMVLVAIAADLVTIPIIVHMTGKVSLVAVVCNLAVTVVVPVITVLGLMAALLAAIYPPVTMLLAKIIIAPAVPCAAWVLQVARMGSGAPMLATPGGWAWAGIASALLAVLLLSVRYARYWRTLRWGWATLMCGVLMIGVWGRGGVIKLEKPDAPATIQTGPVDLTSKVVFQVRDDDQAMRQLQTIDTAVAERGGAQQVAVVVTQCGKPHDRPSFMPNGVPVYYPCKDKVEFR
ncbi:Competence protein ComE-like protein [Corynebacterium jeikeium]|jgi:competence protein ComEC|nr:ComEC/Rec2 family competence protein [Corynebacterium jeikeium]SQI24198.1 Competence protein ComE-like protein [Corynebacterium jeikeium]SUY85914.1 Competence protein ComE-like protein [Corynebacterium jeikeium]